MLNMSLVKHSVTPRERQKQCGLPTLAELRDSTRRLRLMTYHVTKIYKIDQKPATTSVAMKQRRRRSSRQPKPGGAQLQACDTKLMWFCDKCFGITHQHTQRNLKYSGKVSYTPCDHKNYFQSCMLDYACQP